ncbi:uncharacterized protein LOC122931025 [Bufo gargarizans]|uniref:uncharacterized protein LOC122931025 n=1 Tax=Bufo gargarizans TaxID=30331 RepID=UPI001CF46691|nr:uncharacterized protein LOC122931025 [Bufo gargarizans]
MRSWRRQRTERRGFRRKKERNLCPFVRQPAASRALPEVKGRLEGGATPKGEKVEVSFLTPIPSLRNNDARPVGGRLQFFWEEWTRITKNQYILESIRTGFKIEFRLPPPHLFQTTVFQSTSLQDQLLTDIQKLLTLGAIVQVPPSEEFKGHYSKLFLITKPDGSKRTIINLKFLNKWITHHHFKMESIKSAIPLISPGAFLCTLDLKDAYYHVPIHPHCQQYLRFAIKKDGRIMHFQFQCLPFGISSAPRIFTKLVAEIVAYLRQRQVTIVPYLDDFLLVADSEEELELHKGRTLSLLTRLGWKINLEKSDLQPATQKKFLGTLLNSVTQYSLLPQDKQVSIRERIRAFKLKKKRTLREAMQVLGLMTSCITTVPWAQFHTRTLQAEVLASWDKDHRSLNTRVSLSDGAVNSLSWWLVTENLSRGVAWNTIPLKTLTTDASSHGWGAHLGDQFFQGSWSDADALRSSNYRELKAVWESLRAAEHLLMGHHVRVLSDNVTTVCYIKRQGGTKNPHLQDLANLIFSWSEEKILSISATHLKGSLNYTADFLSRQLVRPGEWKLNQEVFQMICQQWGRPQVDLFASSRNTQLDYFFSLDPRGGPLAVDALSQPWDMSLAYAFPPLLLIPLILKKLRGCSSTLILVAPAWPKRAWFSVLKTMSIREPITLPRRQDLLSQGPLFHPNLDKLNLTAWILRGKP